ncbi:filamentous hemagglutinin N-terminal domain-containing protein [Proteus faecis]|uniref:two-partner secretion domain-containing protein n=1 Tax=Proteus faecis TaxID=2050967 RepID=UPI003075CADF
MKLKLLVIASIFTSTCYSNDKLYAIYDDSTHISIQENSSATVRDYNNRDDIAEILIADSDKNKISHNKYNHFSVDESGIILNNETAKAKYIINEVVRGPSSYLAGNISVKGNAAHVIIANPNGISCNGCSFSNTLSETLATAYINTSKDNLISYNTVNFLSRFNSYSRKGIDTKYFGKIIFSENKNIPTKYLTTNFNKLNIISNNISIDMRIHASQNINIYSGINIVEQRLGTNKFHLINNEKGSRLLGKYISKNIIIGNEGNMDEILFTNKIKIHTSNSTINNHAIISSNKLNINLDNASTLKNHGVIAGNSSLIKLTNNSHFKNTSTGVIANLRTDDYKWYNSTDPFFMYSKLHRIAINADNSSRFTNQGALKTHRYLTLNKSTHNIFNEDAIINLYDEFRKIK